MRPNRLLYLAAGFALALAAPGQWAAQAQLSAPALVASPEAARLNQELGQYYQAGRIAEAAERARQLLALAERLAGPDHVDTLSTASNLAFLDDMLGRYAEAEALDLRALAALTRLAGPENPATLTVANNLASIYQEESRYAEAEALLQRTYQGRQHVLGAEHPDTLSTLFNIGFLYFSEGRYDRAEPIMLRALASYERVAGRDDQATLAVVNGLAELYRAQGRFDEAEPLHRRVAETRERILGRDHPGTLASLNNLALVYVAQRRYAEAEPILQRVLQSSERTLGAEHPSTLAALTNVAELYRNQNRAREAQAIYERLLPALVRRGRDNPATLTAYNNLAGLYRDARLYPQAERLYQVGLDISARIYGREHPTTIGVAQNYALTILLEGRQPATALAPARLAALGNVARRTTPANGRFAEVQRARETLGAESRFAMLADADWASAGARPEASPLRAEAFAAMQDAMAGGADDAIVRAAVRRYADTAGAGLGALVRERETLEAQWASTMARYAATFDGAAADAAQSRAAVEADRVRIEARMDAIDARLRAEFPDYFNLVRPDSVAMEETQQVLGPDEALLIALPGFTGTSLIAVTRERVQWGHSDWNALRVNEAVQHLRWGAGAEPFAPPEQIHQWATQESEGDHRRYRRDIAFDLYGQIVAPVAAALAGKRRLYVVAGGSLAGLPFSVLVTTPPQGDDRDGAALRQTAWLAESYALVHIPTVRALLLLRRGAGRSTAPGPASFLGIGNPTLAGVAAERGFGPARNAVLPPSSLTEPAGIVGSEGLARPNALRRLLSLPGTARELENMRLAFGAPPSALLLGDRATERSVRAADLSRVGILVFATHGLMPGERVEGGTRTVGEILGLHEPGLVLTPPAQASAADDGYLGASEVTTLRLNADWVILSACNTATGESLDQGLSLLSRAFFYAGARNLLASHWLVSDEAASRLTVRTVALERGGLGRAEAFQQAMREIRMDATHDQEDSWAHPFYWAPFVLIGDGGR